MAVCFAFEMYISVITSLSWLRVNVLLAMRVSTSVSFALPGDLPGLLKALPTVIYMTLFLLYLVILSRSSAFLCYRTDISLR